MTHTDRLKRRAGTFRQLTGLTPTAFDRLLAALEPRYAVADAKRKNRAGRGRRPGAGRKHKLPLADRLLMLLVYYRTYATHALLGFLSGVDDSAVGRTINPLQPLLTGIFRIPEEAGGARPGGPPRAVFRCHRADHSPADSGAAAVRLGEEEAAYAEDPGGGDPTAEAAGAGGPAAAGADRGRVPDVRGEGA